MKNSVQEVLRRASLFLLEHNREAKIAEILLLHHLHFTKTELLMSLRQEVPAKIEAAFQKDLLKHVTTGVPVQHLTGNEQFYGRNFIVDEHVLVPRPETEELVVAVLNHTKSMKRPLKVLDVGTGSGVIALTLKLEDPSLSLVAADISTQALTVAQRNAGQLAVELDFVQSDFLRHWLDGEQSFDVIVANPPYIPWDEKEELDDTVKNFDPSLALFADADGLYAYQQIIKQAEKVLSTCGLLAFEIGYQQGEQVRQLVKQSFPNSTVEVLKDINRKDRIVIAKIF